MTGDSSAAQGGREGPPGEQGPLDSSSPLLFGDLLALARRHWIGQMSAKLAACGYPDYRRTDAVLLGLLRRRDGTSPTELGSRLGVTRQAARKLVDGLELRGFAREQRDELDARAIRVTLTPAGEAYAEAVIAAVHTLNEELAGRVDPGDLETAKRILRAVIGLDTG